MENFVHCELFFLRQNRCRRGQPSDRFSNIKSICVFTPFDLSLSTFLLNLMNKIFCMCSPLTFLTWHCLLHWSASCRSKSLKCEPYDLSTKVLRKNSETKYYLVPQKASAGLRFIAVEKKSNFYISMRCWKTHININEKTRNGESW